MTFDKILTHVMYTDTQSFAQKIKYNYKHVFQRTSIKTEPKTKYLNISIHI